MGEIANCPKCGTIFAPTKFREICLDCFKEEEQFFEKVYHYIRKKENRTATMEQVVEATGVEEELIIKFIKIGRLRLVQFPNLGYKCDQCGATIREGKLCESCIGELRLQLANLRLEEQRRQEIEERNRTGTYLAKEHKS